MNTIKYLFKKIFSYTSSFQNSCKVTMIGTSIIELEYLFLTFTIILSVASLVDSKSVWKSKKITVTEEVLADADFDIVTVAQTLCLAIASSQRSSFVACFNEEEKRCFAYSGEVSEDSSPSSGWICSRKLESWR